ncbi:hypothetical protein IFT69_15135 [Pseudomonas putida]|nr:hypothetical protein [Pseudomonas putida]
MIEATLGWPKETYEHYSSGNCMHLAAALHRKLGWEIQLTLHPAEDQYLPYVEHAWVVDPGGTFCLCADGLYPINRNGFIGASSPLHTQLSEQDLKAMTLLGAYRPFTDAEWDESILKATAIVERYFPLESITSMLGLAEISVLPVAAKEFTISTLPVLYHGTSRRQWRKRHDEPSYLNLTSSFEDAQRYAEEWAESEFEDYGNCHPMVMRISPAAIENLLNRPGVKLEPDWGWVEGQEHDAKKNSGFFTGADATWQNSLARCHGLGIQGFRDKFKKAFWNVDDSTLELG